MYSFIVLGLIPGTGIQITFEMWLQVAIVVGSLLLSFKMIKKYHQERNLSVSPKTTVSDSVIDTTQLYPSA